MNKKDDLTDIIRPIKEGIDYAFKNHKNQILSKNKNKIDDYLFDIVKTWSLNIELLNNFIESSNKFSKEEKEILIEKINILKNLVENKKNLKNEKQKLSGKLLMDQQILEEFKRRNQENTAYFQEQIDEYQESVDKKIEFVKQYEKKFNEVQIYVQRQVKSQKGNQYEHLANYEVMNFINENEMINKRKMTLLDDIRTLKSDIDNLKTENSEIRKLNETNNTMYGNESTFNEHEKQINLKNIILNYKKKILYVEKKNRQLKAKLEELNNLLKFKSNENNRDKEYKENKEPIVESNIEKLNRLEDVSVIGGFNETNFIGDMQVNKTNDLINRELWDISCIEKKAD